MDKEMSVAIKDALDRMSRQMDEAIFYGGQTVAAPLEAPGLTFDKLKALHDYLKPETVTIAGEEIQIYGYNVHHEFTPPGFTVLTEKDDPNAVLPKRGKLVIINESAGVALLYDPGNRQ